MTIDKEGQNDRKLLELAAKAAGIELPNPVFRVTHDRGVAPKIWNPLTDDSDALRLAVKLCILGNYEIGIAPVNVWHGDDPYAATRRAIVRAAASIGEKL